jgi:hypothetical protein
MEAVFAGSFAVRLVEPVHARLPISLEIVEGHEAQMPPVFGDADALVGRLAISSVG